METSLTFLLTHSLAWVLLYSLAQGLLIYGLLFILLRVLKNAAAAYRYHLSMTAFTAMFIWFADTWISQYQRLKGITIYVTGGGHTVAVPAVQHAPAVHIPESGYAVLRQSIAGLEQYSAIIIGLYCAGLCLMLTRFALSIWQVRTLKQSGVSAPQAHIAELMEYWQGQFSISRPVKLLLSASIDVPMMLGVVKPVILLPVASVSNLSVDQLEAILMHELAHIKRNDYLLNILQTIAETILFFNPFVWLISAEIRKEREHCCDDMVVSFTSDPVPYASALASLEVSRYENGLSLAAAGNKNQLLNRIKRIMEMKKQNVNYGQAGIVALAVVAIICAVAVFTPTFAQKSKQKKENKIVEKKNADAAIPADGNTTVKTVTKTRTITVDSNGNKKIVDKITRDDEDAKVSFDRDDYSLELDNAIKSLAEATKELTNSLSGVDKRDIEREIEDAKREIAKARKQMDDVNWDEIRDAVNKGLDEANRQLSDKNLRIEINREIEEGLKEGERAIADARRQMKQRSIAIYTDDGNISIPGQPDSYDEMLDEMEEDGLINRKKGFSIAKSHRRLTINGEVQPDRVYEKYERYLKAKSISISGSKHNLSISADN